MLFSAPEQSFAKATLNILFSEIICDDGDHCSLFNKLITFGPTLFLWVHFCHKHPAVTGHAINKPRTLQHLSVSPAPRVTEKQIQIKYPGATAVF